MPFKIDFRTFKGTLSVNVFGSYVFIIFVLLLGIVSLAILLWKIITNEMMFFPDDDIKTLSYALIYICAAIIPILLVKKLLKMFNLD